MNTTDNHLFHENAF